jgi:hypothetical protein
MLASRERTLGAARQRGEPVGQIAAPELEVGLTPFSYRFLHAGRLPFSLPLAL